MLLGVCVLGLVGSLGGLVKLKEAGFGWFGVARHGLAHALGAQPG
jgi:hypothetical protein